MKEIEEKDLLLIMTISRLFKQQVEIAGIELAYRQAQDSLAEYRQAQNRHKADNLEL